MLTGQIPFTAETPIAQILMHVQRPVPSVRIHNPSVPIEADQVVKRSMAKRPSDRYSTATLLAEALEAGLLQREPTREGPDDDTVMSPGTRQKLDIDFVVESDPATERMVRAPEAPTPPFIRPLVETDTPGPHKTEVLPYAPRRRIVISRRQAIIGLISLAVLVVVGSVIAASRRSGGPATPTTIAAIPSTTDESVAVIPSATDEVTVTEPPTEATTESPTITASPTTPPTEPPTQDVTPTAEISPTPMPLIIVQSGTDMVLIPEGPFMMGSRVGLQDEGPVHEVFLDSYYIDRNEVTIGGYKHCVDAGACAVPEVVRSRTRFIYYGPPEYDVYPIVNVTWQEAETFCEWRGSNLPTEAQWEKAARWDADAKEAREFPWGTNAVDGFFLNFGGSRFGDTVGVGRYPPGRSWYGVNDMSGNVAEWVYDWFSEDFYSITPYTNPIGPETGTEKVFRGGSYASFGAELRSAARQHGDPDSRNEAVGFRCAYNPNGFPMP
jgi:formylglycine-generating enzyme required for sulfatase activity